MKINVLPILKEHWRTLYDARSNRASVSDIVVFLVVPITVGALVYFIGYVIKPEAYNVSITFFGIFVALLLNIQVAIYGIFQRKWDIPSDTRQAELLFDQLESRRTILRELNANIAYLTVFSTVSLIYFLVLFAFDVKSLETAVVASILYTHFIMTFLMVVKRSYALFQKEYRDSPSDMTKA